jgi:hypothetical protein
MRAPPTPRILAIMGSGETAPTMAKVHRSLFERLGSRPVPAAILDTPYGFQENADDVSARTVEFFESSVGRAMSVASYRSNTVDAVDLATAVARIREARYLMAGPGSPSYALRHWMGGPIPEVLAAQLAAGGILTMASAAALTLGALTIPVYEIYKAGEDPHWLQGLDLLGPATGLMAAIVPHYDNAEGGNHDTRFCYMGERRLRILEASMPAEAFILGVDSHTALVLDLDRRMAAIFGLGAVTVRVRGRSMTVPAGSEIPIEGLGEVAQGLAKGRAVDIKRKAGTSGRAGPDSQDVRGAPRAASLKDATSHLEGSFVDAIARGGMRSAVAALLDLDEAISARTRTGEDSPDLDNASAMFRSLIARLGEVAEVGARDPRELLDPFVTALLDLRARARAIRDWETADLVRDRLTAAGVEVRDEAEASSWVLPGAARD